MYCSIKEAFCRIFSVGKPSWEKQDAGAISSGAQAQAYHCLPCQQCCAARLVCPRLWRKFCSRWLVSPLRLPLLSAHVCDAILRNGALPSAVQSGVWHTAAMASCKAGRCRFAGKFLALPLCFRMNRGMSGWGGGEIMCAAGRDYPFVLPVVARNSAGVALAHNARF